VPVPLESASVVRSWIYWRLRCALNRSDYIGNLLVRELPGRTATATLPDNAVDQARG
jgi:hypothetical protein